MRNLFGGIFSAGLALALLALYAVSAMAMVFDILQNETADALKREYKPGYIYVLTTVGGLVSALVVAKLSVTTPGDMPSVAGVRPTSTVGKFTNAAVVSVYLLVWALVGMSCLIVGVMLFPDVNSTVSDIGTAWLGLAVSSAYVYFGIDMMDNRGNPEPNRRDAVPDPDPTVAALERHIDNGRIRFDRDTLRRELLGQNSGPKVTEALQKLVLHMAETVPDRLRIASLIRPDDKHATGKAVDIGNVEVAPDLLPDLQNVLSSLSIDKVIFDASEAGQDDRNLWNVHQGSKHDYDPDTLDHHKDHIHIAVT